MKYRASFSFTAPAVTRAVAASAAAACLALSPLACSESTPDPLVAPEAGTTPTLATPSNACTDAVEAVYGDPGPLAVDPAARGNIVRCAKDADVSKDAMQAKLTELGYVGKPLSSGARVYRIAYRTERGNEASSPAVSSAAVYIPETPRADKLPIVVAARGSRGQAANCAVSKLDPSQKGINDDAFRLVYPLVGQGYAVIVSDLAGYANFGAPGNPPSAYAQAQDVAKSTLDSGRALKKLFPVLDDKVVLVGHSQGGHSALASLALAESYGTAAPIVGAAVYAPLWLSQRSWGAILSRAVGKDFPIDKSSAAAVSVWYHYTQAELLDGPGEGKKLFAPGKQDALESFVKTTCWEGKEAVLKPQGTFADEYFDPEFVRTVGQAAVGIFGGCDPADARCAKWLKRYSEDRPHLAGAAATTPILLAYGGKDTTIPPERMKCGLDRLAEDKANVTVCYDAEQGHGTILSAKADYVSDWIASVALGAPAPAACAMGAGAITVACATPPPND